MRKGKPSPDTTVYHKAFHDTFGDAVWFAQEAHRIQSPEAPLHLVSRYTRNAILSAGLAIECAANCCLEHLSTHPAADDDLERLRPLAKLDLYLMSSPCSTRLDRDNTYVRKAANLVSIRNSYVHARVVTKEYISTGQDLAETGNSKKNWTPIMIPRNQSRWRVEHTRNAATALVDFLNYFFFVVGPFDDGRPRDCRMVNQILSSEFDSQWEKTPTEGRLPMFEIGSEGIHGELSDEWGLDFAFLGMVSFRNGKEIIKPSDRL